MIAQAELESLSLSCINSLQHAISIIPDITNLINTPKVPSGILDNSDAIVSKIRELEQEISCIPDKLNSLRMYYLSILSEDSKIRSSFIEKIEQRKSSDIQMNSMVSLYTEDKVLYDIKVDVNDNGFFHPGNLGVKLITKPEEFSVLSLIKRIESLDVLIHDLNCTVMNFFKDSHPAISTMKENLLSAKNLLESYDFITSMNTDHYTEDADTYKKQLTSLITNCSHSTLTWQKLKLNRLFQAFLALDSNMRLYGEAVKSYTSFALESAFNPNSRYTIL